MSTLSMPMPNGGHAGPGAASVATPTEATVRIRRSAPPVWTEPAPGDGRGNSLPIDVRLMQATTRLLLWLAVLAVLAGAGAWAVRQPVFKLQGIRIEGDVSRNSATTLRANVAPHLVGNFLTLDLQRAREAFESVPWVRHAVVRRVWPGRLVVTLEEHQPAALWAAEDGNDRLVNSHGEVFEANTADVEDAGLTTLSGPDGSSAQMLAMLRRLAPLLAPLQAGDMGQLKLSARGSWQAELDSGAVIALGRGTEDEVVARAQRFVQTMPRVTATYQRPLASADLRHGDGFAVRLRGLGTAAPVVAAPHKR